MILNKARENGASILEQTKANRLIKNGGRVTGIKANSQEFGELVLDCPCCNRCFRERLFCCPQGELDGP